MLSSSVYCKLKTLIIPVNASIYVCLLFSRNYLLRKSVALRWTYCKVVQFPRPRRSALDSPPTTVPQTLCTVNVLYQHFRKPIQWAFLVTGATNSAEQVSWYRCGKCRYTPQQSMTGPYRNDKHPESYPDPSPDPFSLLTQLHTAHIPLNKHLYCIERAQSLLLHWYWGIGSPLPLWLPSAQTCKSEPQVGSNC